MTIIESLKNTERLAKCTKLERFFHHPIRYGWAFIFRKFIYPYTKQEINVSKRLFFGVDMAIALPASTDIYLTGGKSHESEIRLAKFIIKELAEESFFMDIGAHYGYFSILASHAMEGNGKVFSFEPTEKSFSLLEKNTKDRVDVKIHKMAVSDTNEDLAFYEFPNLQSEYNTSDVEQFKNAPWFEAANAIKRVVKATTIDEMTTGKQSTPDMIKIDVEGAEYKVLYGGINFLSSHSPTVIMEYLAPNRSNENHIKAVDFMKSIGYTTHIIDTNGILSPISDLNEYIIAAEMESDNVVFRKIDSKH